jgi:hypothetical protein
MRLKKLIIQGILLPLLVIGFGIASITGAYATSNNNNNPPTQSQVGFATKVADRMQTELFAALLNEFEFTATSPDPDKVPVGNHAISLIFNDKNRDMRLIGTVKPLRKNDLPSDDFERTANMKTLAGVLTIDKPYTSVERVKDQWYYRRAVPLSNFSPACVLCHTNFGKTPNANEWVGALALRVPIKK